MTTAHLLDVTNLAAGQDTTARFGLYFGLDPQEEVRHYRQAARQDKPMLHAFCREMYGRGDYVAPAWHHGLCALHTTELVDAIVAAAESAGRIAGNASA